MSSRSIKIGNINIRSILPSIHDIRQIILVNSFDVFCITETWLHKDIPDDVISIDGYKLYRRDRGSRGGGICTFVKNSFTTSLIPLNSNTIEQLWINLKNKNENIAIGVVYRPPSQDSAFFLSEFEDTLSLILPRAQNIICSGDFNFNMYNFSNLNVQSLYAVLDEFGLKQIVDSPTRITNITSTLLDLIMVLNEDTVLEKGVVDYDLSDHQLVYCVIEMCGRNTEPRMVTYRDYKNFNYTSFEEDLYAIPFYNIFDINNVDDKVSFLVDNLISLFDRHAPSVTKRFTKPPAPWLTDIIRTMINIRDRALVKYRKTNYQNDFIYYKQLRNLTSQAIKREKKAFLTHKLNNSSAHECWKILKNNDIVFQNKNRSIPESLKNVNDINNFFVNSLPFTDASDNTLNYYKNNLLFDSVFKFTPVDETALLKVIMEISTNATGCDQVNLKMIKLCCPHIIPYLTHIINYCLQENVFPTTWKSAVITVLPKKSNPEEFKDLRAISVLPTLSKILEKIMENQLRAYLAEKKILPKTQSGFRSGYSCTTALLQVVDDIIGATDQGLCTILILLDFSRAFDTLNHEILLSLLLYIGLTKEAVTLFKNYLQNRQQKVSIEYDSSEDLVLRSGVPQGSILGPLLFTLYTSQFVSCLKHCQIHLYADDTQLYYSFNTSEVDSACSRINEDLKSFINISKDHCLIINASKSNVLLFGPKKSCQLIKNQVQINIDQENIEIVEYAKNLGVIIDSDLRFGKHINKLTQKAYNSIKLIYGNRHYLPQKIKVMLCESLVLSLLDYADCLYGPNLTALYKYKVQKIQNSCLRLIYGIRKRERISHKLKDAGWLNMENRRLFHSACLYHKILTKKSPEYLYNKIKFRTDVHNLNLRFKGLLTPPIHRTEHFKRSFRYQICKVYNPLPENLKEMNLSSFKRTVKMLIYNR